MSESTDILHRLRELSVYAANGSHSNSDRESLQTEISALNTELTNIAKTTSFGGKKLLDGSFINKSFGTSELDQFNINFNLSSAEPDEIFQQKLFKYELSGTTAGTINSRPWTDVINQLSSRSVSQNFHIQSKGVSTQPITYDYSTSVYDITNKINAALDSANLDVTASSTNTVNISNFNSSAATGDLLIAIGKGIDNKWSFNMNSHSLSDLSTLAEDINSANIDRLFAKTSDDKMTLILESSDDISIRFTKGNADLTNAQGASRTTVTNRWNVAIGTIALTGRDEFTMYNADNKLFADINAASKIDDFFSNVKIDVSSQDSAQHSINVVDRAINKLLEQRTELGAQQNSLAHTMSNLENINNNLTQSKGRILDTDYAAQTSKMVKSKLLYESSLSLMSHIKKLSDPALQLLSSEPILSS